MENLALNGGGGGGGLGGPHSTYHAPTPAEVKGEYSQRSQTGVSASHLILDTLRGLVLN